MKQSLARRLQKLEQTVQARHVSAAPAATGAAEIVRGWLREWGVEQQPEESLAMALARGMGISSRELRRRLEARAWG